MDGSIFTRKCCCERTYPQFGRVIVYMGHDENMGKCLFEDGFITPNMPKLQYAIGFEVRDDNLILKNELSEIAMKFFNCKVYVFEKRDGFNLLFYRYKDQVIPKTRLKPIATGKTSKVIELPEFPYQNVVDMVMDDYIPVFEVWGTKLDELGILHGPVDCKTVQEKERLPDLNAEVIAIMKADYRHHEYTFIPPEEMIEVASSYGLKTVPLHGVVELNPSEVVRLMEYAENLNRPTTVIEGFVLHCSSDGYGMFKVKPYDIMSKDVITSKTIPRDRILLEVTKILLETDVFEVARNPGEYLGQVYDYLKEDFQLTKDIQKKVKLVFAEAVAMELLKRDPGLTPERAGRSGIQGMFIRFISQIQKEKPEPVQPHPART